MLTIICVRDLVDDEPEFWRGIDDILSEEERFAHLHDVCIVLRVKESFSELWLADDDWSTTLTGTTYDLTFEDVVPKTWAPGILRVY